METTRILWSGLTGRTGREAVKAARSMPDVKIVAGMKRNVSGADDFQLRGELFENVEWLDYKTGMCGLYGLARLTERAEIDIIVDFSHPDVFEKVLELAIRTGKPLISGTSDLSNRQLVSLYDATNRIPVFRGGNFRFKVKKFIDEAVKFVKTSGGNFTLFENFYEGKSLPSETSKAIRRRIHEKTGVMIEVHSAATLGKNSPPICNWELLRKDKYSQGAYLAEGPRCCIAGFDELAQDVLEIAKVMAKKPVKKGELYDLDELWDDLVSWAL